MTAPVATTASSMTAMLPSCLAIRPVMAADSPSGEPMDTSISPVMMTKAMPMARSVYIVAVLKQLMMLE